MCLIAAAVIAVQGLIRVAGKPTPTPVTGQAASLRLGTVGSGPPPAALPTTATARQTTRPDATPMPVTSAVDVVNATDVTGLAGRTASALRAHGVVVASIGNLRAALRPEAGTVFYPPGRSSQARTLASLAGAPVVAPTPTWFAARGRLVLVVTDPKPPTAS